MFKFSRTSKAKLKTCDTRLQKVFIMTDEQRILKLENFLKEVFRIDGDCKYKQFDTLVSLKEGTSEKVLTFILDDTKRGKFKVCLSNGG